METNILKAINNIFETPIFNLKEFYSSKNRANNMGKGLEEYVKDIFAGTINEVDEIKRIKILSEKFSYLGNQNNPPDIIIKQGDAIEVKKIENKNATIALNSSYPKNKLYSESKMITQACKDCEEWKEKDILYTIGTVNKEGSSISSLVMVYGEDYAAEKNIYKKIKDVISEGIESIENVQFAETKELGRVNNVDPLGITYLRIRGMWGIENPLKVFEYIYEPPKGINFEFMAVINEKKYNTFNTEDIQRIEKLDKENKNFNIISVKIKEPNNPAKLNPAKLITFFR